MLCARVARRDRRTTAGILARYMYLSGPSYGRLAQTIDVPLTSNEAYVASIVNQHTVMERTPSHQYSYADPSF